MTMGGASVDVGYAAGLQAPPVPLRLAARMLDVILGVVAIGVVALIVGGGAVTAISITAGYVAWAAVEVAAQLAVSALPGQFLLGLHHVVPATGRPAGGRTLCKYLLMGLASTVSCGLLPIVALLVLDQPLRRSWFDRAAGLVITRRTPLRPAGAGSSPNLVQQQPAPVSPGAIGHPHVSQPPVLALPADAPAPRSARLRLLLDNGREVTLDRSYVLGRDPEAPVNAPGAVPLPVADDARSISKTHLLIESDGEVVSVCDLHSTNGVTITQPGAPTVVLRPGDPFPVQPGSIIGYGDRSVEVLT